jgi:hypothetical protein
VNEDDDGDLELFLDDFTDTVTQVMIKAGVMGTKYKITNRIVTNEIVPRKGERHFFIRIVDK